MTQLSGLFWLARHFGQTVRLCVGARQWQPAAGRAVGGVASDQLWHAVCIWTNAHMLTRRVPNSRARQSASHCPLSARQGDGGGVHLLLFPPLWVIVSEPRCSSNVQCCTRAFHPSYLTLICMFLCTPVLSVLSGWMHQRVFMYVWHALVCILLFTCPCLRRCDRNHASAASFSTISRVRLASLWKTERFWAWKTSHVHSWPIRPLQSGEEEQRYGAFIHKLLLLKFR